MNKHLFFLALAIGLISCSGDPKAPAESAESLLQKIDALSSPDSLKNPANLREYTDAVKLFVAEYPEHPRHEKLLFLAAGNSGQLRDFETAVELHKQYVQLYPNTPAHAQSLFGIAYLYNNELGQIDSSRKYYELFVERYPDHPLTGSAITELENLGKTPEEMLKGLMEKQKE